MKEHGDLDDEASWLAFEERLNECHEGISQIEVFYFDIRDNLHGWDFFEALADVRGALRP